MSIFNLFKKKRELTIEEQQWNKMWDLWVEEKARSPYAELMTYETEINNGGHGQFFDNVSSDGDLPKTISKLNTVLSDVLKDNLNNAYEAYSRAGEDDETLEKIFDECDDVFYENESEIERILKEYAKKIEL